MVGKAKSRVEQIEEQLHHARIDYEATVKATNDAQASAQIAQNNAAEAAAKASITSLHDIHSTIQAHGSSNHHISAPAPAANNDQSAKSSNIKPSIASEKSSPAIASNHNYANTEFRPSKPYTYSGY